MNELSVSNVAALVACFACYANAAVIEEDFATDPALRGWKTHGASQLFSWDQQSGSLQVTWDSTLTNSYFYKPLGMVLTKGNEFSLAFDLRLDEVTVGTFELAIGLLNLADATRPGFLRGTGLDSPNLAEFDYFPDWTSVDATTSDTASALQMNYDDVTTLNPGGTYRVVLKHAAGDGMMTGEVYHDGVLYRSMSKSYANPSFTDFRVDTLAIISYDGLNSFGSELQARGAVDNLVLNIPYLVGHVNGGHAGAAWEIKVSSSTNCVYTLERTADLKTWSEVGPGLQGTGRELILSDPTPPAVGALYRVKATW